MLRVMDYTSILWSGCAYLSNGYTYPARNESIDGQYTLQNGDGAMMVMVQYYLLQLQAAHI